MNRSIGTVLLTAALIAAFSRSGPEPPPLPPYSRVAHAAPPTKSPPRKGEKLCPACIPKPPDADIKDTIEEFLGKSIASPTDKSIPLKGQSIDVLLVTVPDPVETHLSLFFDRHMDALQQALTREGYLFAGGTLPWDPKQHAESDDWQTREGELEFVHSREEMPGLLIYRASAEDNGAAAKPLFVLVVGETPTTGIHKDQFQRAFAMFNAWTASPKRLRILGPTFSGSLYSMIEILQSEKSLRSYEVYLHSGTVTSGKTAANFKKWLGQNGFDKVHFASFQENDDYDLQQFLMHLRTRGYLNQKPPRKTIESCYCRKGGHEKCSPRASCLKQETKDLPRITEVVVLTEDETAYGLLQEQTLKTTAGIQAQPLFCDDVPEQSFIATLSFPRDISQLRSAYQEDFLKSEASTDRKLAPHTALPLDFEDTGGDKDTIATYAHRQTPLSQEAVLFGIITNLKKLHPDFVVIRATNPLDELFLARFLRQTYPKVRVVTIGADLLFQQQRDDAILQGTLAISPYSLRPDVDRYLPPVVPSQTAHVSVLTFPSSFSAGVYNAALSLLECEQPIAAVSRPCLDAPPAPHHEYGWSREWPEDDTSVNIARPAVWLLVLGNDGYWPLARLNRDALFSTVAGPHRTLPTTEPIAVPLYNVSYHLSKDWNVLGLVVVTCSVLFTFLCWSGSAKSASQLLSAFDPGPDPRRTAYLTISAIILLIAVMGLFLPYAWIPFYDSKFLFFAIPIGVVSIVVLFPLNLLLSRAAYSGFQLFVEAALFIALGGWAALVLATVSARLCEPFSTATCDLWRFTGSPCLPTFRRRALVVFTRP